MSHRTITDRLMTIEAMLSFLIEHMDLPPRPTPSALMVSQEEIDALFGEPIELTIVDGGDE